MFEKFPYTNLHELNLDWIIRQLIKIAQGAVLSVNGQTGDVILYQDAEVRLPDVVQPDGTWRFFRYVNGKPVGIKFDENGKAYMVDNYINEAEIYTERNPPDYPVQSVNGQTGVVELYQENAIRLPNVSESYWNIRKQVDTEGSPSIEGVEFRDGLPMQRMSGQNRYPMYDEGNPPPYPVRSVNGQTGDVNLTFPVTSVNGQTGAVTIIIPVTSVNGQTGNVTIDPFVSDATSPIMAVYQVPANASEWGLTRQTKNGQTLDNVQTGIVFKTDGENVTGYIRMVSGSVVTDLRILTPADIPSDTGVVSVNGMAGAVVLTADDIKMAAGDGRSIKTLIDGLTIDISDINDQMSDFRNSLSDAFSTSSTYAVGDLVIYQDRLYRCSTAVTTAGAWNAANWTATSVDTEIQRKADAVNSNIAPVENGDTASQNYNQGEYIIWKGALYHATTAIASGATLAVGTNLAADPDGVGNALNDNLFKEYTLLGNSTVVSQSDSTAQITVPSLSKYRAIILAIGNSNDLLCPIIIPISLYINGLRWFTSYGMANAAYTGWTRYINDTTVCLALWNSGATDVRLYGMM